MATYNYRINYENKTTNDLDLTGWTGSLDTSLTTVVHAPAINLPKGKSDYLLLQDTGVSTSIVSGEVDVFQGINFRKNGALVCILWIRIDIPVEYLGGTPPWWYHTVRYNGDWPNLSSSDWIEHNAGGQDIPFGDLTARVNPTILAEAITLDVIIDELN